MKIRALLIIAFAVFVTLCAVSLLETAKSVEIKHHQTIQEAL